MKGKKLHKDLQPYAALTEATTEISLQNKNIGIALMFLFAVWAFAGSVMGFGENSVFILAAAVIGGYMALNIGANDVANNVGPAVGSKALTMYGAIIIAVIFEAAGAILAGGDVVDTISKGIIDPALIANSDTFIWVMMAALMAAAAWVNLATWVGAPVSTTHSVVGGVAGAGIAAAGLSAVNWVVMSQIAASWVISPVMGGIIAAGFLYTIKTRILMQEDKISAAKRWVPLLVAVMAGAFATYLTMKGLKRIWRPDPWMIAAIGASAFALSWAVVRPIVGKAAAKLENRRKAISSLFTIPLICSAALLSFAHGANDVANAVGPLAAIVGTVTSGDIATKVSVDLWVMVIGAAGIGIGLALFGPKLIRTVGQEITRLDQIRAYCVALSAAITVIIASAFGLPVSSTHIAVGAVFGVGFLREYLANEKKRSKAVADTSLDVAGDQPEPENAADDGEEMSLREARAALAEGDDEAEARIPKSVRRQLVRRGHVRTIVAAWLITVPCSAALSAILYFFFRGLFLKVGV